MVTGLVLDNKGDPDYFAALVQDISERKRGEEAQRMLAQQVEIERSRLLEAQALAKVGNWETDLTTMDVTWSEELYRIFGVSPAESQMSYAKVSEMVHPADRSIVDRAFFDSFENGSASAIEHRIVTPNEGVKFVEEYWKIFRDESGEPVRALGTTQDITDRVRAAEALRETNRRLRDLSGRLVRAEESERGRISRELHDQFGQELTALTLDLKILEKRNPGQPDLIARCVATVSLMLEQVRDLTLTLRPSQLDDLGLVAALRGQLERHVKMHGIEVHFDETYRAGHVSPDLEAIAFRIAQEALTNILRHSKGRNVWLTVSNSENELRLEIRDDGAGFDVAAAMKRSTEGQSSGLRNLCDRADLAGGVLIIGSTPGMGTIIRATFPLPGERTGRS